MVQKTSPKDKLTFKPKDISKKLLAVLSDRAREVLSRRYGLGTDAKRYTLEAIGEKYSITRERVRQIENFAIGVIKKSDLFTKIDPVFAELKRVMENHGGITHEQEFLESLSKDKSTQNHIHFLMVLSDSFIKMKEDDEFYHRWTVDATMAEKVEASLRRLHKKFNDNDLLSENDLVSAFVAELKEVVGHLQAIEDFARRWIKISKVINSNPLGEWGLSSSPNVKMRGIRDYAYLVLRREGQPLHFTDVARSITKCFGRGAHPATCHNELIKDKRFVLVGRGLYALTEWGYQPGIVREVIKQLLATKGPLSKDDLVREVMKARHVKENTILVNLQNPKFFKKNANGLYIVA